MFSILRIFALLSTFAIVITNGADLGKRQGSAVEDSSLYTALSTNTVSLAPGTSNILSNFASNAGLRSSIVSAAMVTLNGSVPTTTPAAGTSNITSGLAETTTASSTSTANSTPTPTPTFNAAIAATQSVWVIGLASVVSAGLLWMG